MKKMNEIELQSVIGGASNNVEHKRILVQCQHCPGQFKVDMALKQIVCPHCLKMNTFAG